MSPPRQSTGNKTPNPNGAHNLNYKGSKIQQRKGSQQYLKNSHGMNKQNSASRLSDYSAEVINAGNPPKTNPHHAQQQQYAAVKHAQRTHRPSSSLEHKQEVMEYDSGAGIISNNQSSLFSNRDDPGFHDRVHHQRGIQSSKAAIQSRRKHGSMDNYVQNENSGSGSKFTQSSSQKRLQQQ